MPDLTKPLAELEGRITGYLSNGGLFNPEVMEHDKVRALLIDIRNTCNAVRAQLDEAALDAHDAEVEQRVNDRWLLALLDTEHGGMWDLSKMEESAKRYQAYLRNLALEEAAHAWDTHTIPSTFHDIYVAIQNHILALKTGGSK